MQDGLMVLNNRYLWYWALCFIDEL